MATRPLGVGVHGEAGRREDRQDRRATSFPKGAFSKVEDVLDRPVISNILLDEPILEGRLAAKGSGLGLAPTIPVGMRAVSVRVNDVAGVAGFVLPGMHVDVLVTGTSADRRRRHDHHLSAEHAGAVGRADHAAGCARPGDPGPDGHAAGRSGAGRNADAGRQRRDAFNWCCAIRAIRPSRRRRAATSPNCIRPSRRRQAGGAEAAPRPRPTGGGQRRRLRLRRAAAPRLRLRRIRSW